MSVQVISTGDTGSAGRYARQVSVSISRIGPTVLFEVNYGDHPEDTRVLEMTPDEAQQLIKEIEDQL